MLDELRSRTRVRRSAIYVVLICRRFVHYAVVGDVVLQSPALHVVPDECVVDVAEAQREGFHLTDVEIVV